ncbi:MAG: hypothetical protein K0S54_1135 [Alphaproteobacteria bacterium]|jgi:hypothetical protein|nr:hypothetical protein [Alphaproteobacteria bacterium]
MRYPLNVTPMNGNETHFGFGAAQQAMSASAAGHLVMHSGGVAAMQAAASGGGVVAIIGSGAAAMALAAHGKAKLIMHGIAQSARAHLAAIGEGVVIPFLGGAARMSMTGSGIGTIAAIATGAARMVLGAVDASANSIAQLGSGVAKLRLSGSAGIPWPKLVPQTFAAAHPSRILMVASAPKVIRQFQERAIAVPPEMRIVHVAPERDR